MIMSRPLFTVTGVRECMSFNQSVLCQCCVVLCVFCFGCVLCCVCFGLDVWCVVCVFLDVCCLSMCVVCCVLSSLGFSLPVYSFDMYAVGQSIIHLLAGEMPALVSGVNAGLYPGTLVCIGLSHCSIRDTTQPPRWMMGRQYALTLVVCVVTSR
eukprot:GFYU01013514.1.p2 GENE.GFYU01013514.1~~GFYU01013514.1.p2  ORF type:complete len:154 (-),score=4.63 GFYU01013514.1:394-855(-)